MPNATPTKEIANFPGRNSLVDPSDIAAGAGATIAQDCFFGPGWVKTRQGFGAYYSGITGSPSINGIVRTGRLDGSARVLLFGSNGALIPEASEGTLGSNIESALGLNQRMVGTGLAGRSILAFSDFQKGLQPAMMYAEPATGAPVTAYPRLGVPVPPGPTSVVDGAAGTITAGVHDVCVVARSLLDGGVSAPSTPKSWTAAGSKKATVNFDTGYGAPPDFVFDIYMTASGAPGYFYFTGTTTFNITGTPVVTIDANDSYLLSQARLDYPDNLFNRFEPPAAAGVFGPYHGRVCLTGLAHSFSAGYEGASGPVLRNMNFVYGIGPTTFQDWTTATPAAVVVQRDTSPNGASYWTYLKIIGNGAAGSFSANTQNFYGIVQPGSQVGVRVRARKTSALVQGDLFVDVQFSLGHYTATIPNASLSTEWQTFEMPVFSSGVPLVVTANTASFFLVLTVAAANTPTNTGELHIDYVEPYDVRKTHQPYTALWSLGYASASGREFDSAIGFQTVGYGDGQDLVGGFELGGRWYYWKTHSTWVTDDNGNEPAFWNSPQWVADVGSPSLAGVSRGEEWVVILSRSGLYFFQGGGLSNENRLTDEIGLDWEKLNWTYGSRMWVQVDTERKRIYCGVVVGAATVVNQIWVLDYREGFGNSGAINSYTGQPVGFGRKWSFWTFQGTCAALIQRVPNIQVLWIGNSLTNGKVYYLNQDSGSLYVDDGNVVIPFLYETGNVIAGEKPGFMGLFTKISFNVSGSDQAGEAWLDLSYTREDNVNIVLPVLPIYPAALGDPFTKLRFIGERMRVRFGTSVVNRWAMVHGLTVEYRPARFRSSRLVNP